MKSIILALALLTSPSYANDMVFEDGDTIMRLMKTSCPEFILDMISPESRNLFRGAAGILGDRSYIACWTLHKGNIYLKFEDGSDLVIDRRTFELQNSI